ncbi:hypothetical protein C3B55_00217 [Candidatus Pseudomonas adelgestsugas]|uniref:Uncharacterized protein n=1 Tax=Candidatus Pseudomonas adelgestsugas TaxID=1302376 RepID=A0ABX5R7F8_9PSED|nr:hypothetical protein C3B55_00217 [Candidatus Pseudomonas adelgestsugas]
MANKSLEVRKPIGSNQAQLIGRLVDGESIL